jgi:hypothetical protein
LPPADDGFWFYYNQLGSPFSPDSRDQGPEQPIPVSYHRFAGLAFVHDGLLTKDENPQLSHTIEPCEADEIEKLQDHDHKQSLHAGSMKS